MPKHEPFSAKAVAKQIKSKGLQRLRWYCQMCQKQCRDENGFKCHSRSESHIRMMKVFSQNAGSFISDFSRQFEAAFMSIIRVRARNPILINHVYQDYIRDKNHVHLKATRWGSLAGFARYLGKTGKAEVEETEQGWMVRYINRDPEMMERQRAAESRQKMELDEQKRNEMLIAAQIKESSKQEAKEDTVQHQLVRTASSKVSFGLQSKKKPAKRQRPNALEEDGSKKSKTSS